MEKLEFKGTKGSWKLGGNTLDGILVSVRHPQNRDVCTVWKYDDSFLENQEALANAKLIASAPDLLEALQEVRKHMNAYIPEKVFDLVDQAIEKALK